MENDYLKYYGEWITESLECLSKIHSATEGLPVESRQVLNDKGISAYHYFQERKLIEKRSKDIKLIPSGNNVNAVKTPSTPTGEPQTWKPSGTANVTFDKDGGAIFNIKFSDGDKAEVPQSSLSTKAKKDGDAYFSGEIRGYKTNIFMNGKDNYSVHELR